MGDRLFDGKVVVVTGAGRGIGREHALLLGALGARVVVNDLGAATDGQGRDQSPAAAVVEEIIKAGGEACANTADVSTSEGAQQLIDDAVEQFGDLHALINNAGIIRDRMLVNMTDDEWDLSLQVNLRGCFAPSRAAARYWRGQANSGREIRASIVNTSSESGVFANVGQSNYAAAKSGVATLTEVWHKELGRYGVRVNAILPRARTRLTVELMAAPEAGKFDDLDPANVSPFVAYLASDRCAFSGQVFLVGGGRVQRAVPWSLDPDWHLERGMRWEMDELIEEVAAAGQPSNVGRDTGGIVL